jgi:hypothetical protein
MSSFKDFRNEAHPQKRSMLMSALISVLIFNLCLQIWLLYTALNNALAEHTDIAIPAFVASVVIFLGGLIWLYFLPQNAE